MPSKPIPMSDTRSSNARAHSAPAFRNTNHATYIENAKIWNQPQFVAPAPRGQPQTTPSSCPMGPPTIIPPSVTGRSDIQARFDEIYFTSPLPRSISNIYSTLQTQPQASPNSPSTITLQQKSTLVPHASPGASQSYHASAQNINPNTRFRSITQAATQTFAAARQLANAPTQTFGGMGPLSAADTGTAAATFQTYTTENGIKVYVGPFSNAYAYFGLTPPNMHTAEMGRQSNNTRACENKRSTDTADTSVSAGKEPATPPHSQGRAFSPSPAYSPLLAPVLDLQKLASPLKISVMSEASKSKRKSQQVARAIEAESEPITQVLEVQQEAKPSNESVKPEVAKTDVNGKGKAIQTDTEPEAAVFDMSGPKNIIHSRAQPKMAVAIETSVTASEMAAAVVTMDEQKQIPENVALDTQLITTSKPESDAEQVEKKIIAVETEKQLQALDQPWRIDLFESDSAKRLREISRVSQPVTERTTRLRANMRRAKNRTETEPETPEVERPSSRRLSGRATLTPRPWWIAGSMPVSVAPVRAQSGSVQPPSVNGKRKRSARNEEQDEQATEQHARRSRTRRFTSGTAQSDSMEYPSVNKNAQQEKASIREDQAIQGQIIDVIQEHNATTAANVPKVKRIKSEDEYQYTYDLTSSQEYHGSAATTSANNSETESINEYLNNIIQEHNGQNAAVATYNSEVVSIRDEEDEYEAYQACDGLDESITVYEEEEPEIQEFAHENNWEQVIENESQQGDEDDLVDYNDLPQSPQRPNYPRIWLYPPNQACYYAAYYENDSPEYPYYMRQQPKRYDEDNDQSRSPPSSNGRYQPQDNKNEYQLEGSESGDQPQGFDDGSGEYIDLPENPLFQNGYQEEQEDGNLGDELPPNHRYYLEMQGAIFDSSSSNPFQSPGRGRTVLQGTKRTFTGLSPPEPRETPPQDSRRYFRERGSGFYGGKMVGRS
ncbi:hypothetical protein BGX38DRAFT_546865 [Terfezia claveryi]|nr:hypothetical protein BGX38DRAFT_546865 [Terfezia claveryi]